MRKGAAPARASRPTSDPEPRTNGRRAASAASAPASAGSCGPRLSATRSCVNENASPRGEGRPEGPGGHPARRCAEHEDEGDRDRERREKPRRRRAELPFRKTRRLPERRDRQTDRRERDRDRVGKEAEARRRERREAEPHEDSRGDRDGSPESRRPFEQRSEAERDQERLQRPVGRRTGESVLQPPEAPGRRGDVLQENRRDDDRPDRHEAVEDAVHGGEERERQGHPESRDRHHGGGPHREEAGARRLPSEDDEREKEQDDGQSRGESGESRVPEGGDRHRPGHAPPILSHSSARPLASAVRCPSRGQNVVDFASRNLRSTLEERVGLLEVDDVPRALDRLPPRVAEDAEELLLDPGRDRPVLGPRNDQDRPREGRVAREVLVESGEERVLREGEADQARASGPCSGRGSVRAATEGSPSAPTTNGSPKIFSYM